MARTELRDLRIDDLVELEKLAKFPLQNLVNKPKFLEKTFEDENGLLGSVIVTKTLELAVILADRSDRDKVRVLRKIDEFVYRVGIENGYRDLHIFVNDPKFADIMVQHFGFEYCNGRALVKIAKNGKRSN